MSTPAYQLRTEDALFLQDVLKSAHSVRQAQFCTYAEEHSVGELANLFAEFLALALAVQKGANEFHGMFFSIESGSTNPYMDDVNLPTLEGALIGVRVARTPTKGMCESCAFRSGSVPNQCEVTVSDALYALEQGSMQFRCHQELDDEGEPIGICAGFAAARAEAEAKERSL